MHIRAVMFFVLILSVISGAGCTVGKQFEAGGTVRTANVTENAYPSWSPEGSRFVFSSNRSGVSRIYLFKLNDTSPVDISRTDGPDFTTAHSWSGNGEDIVFSSTRNSRTNIFRMNIGESVETKLTGGTRDDYPAFSRDGSSIVYSELYGEKYRIVKIDRDGRNKTVVFDGLSKCWKPSFSPDGAKIIFQAYAAGNQWDIYEVTLSTGNAVNLTETKDRDEIDPSYSPDGKSIIYSAGKSSTFYIYKMLLETREETVLYRKNAYSASPSYDSTGSRILFMTDYASSGLRIWVMNSDGSNASRVF